MRKVCCVQAKTLKFSPHVQLHKVTYGPKYRPPRPLATGTKKPQKNLEIRFPTKWRWKLLPVPVFGHIHVLHPRLGWFSQKSQKFSGALFRDIWGQSWKIQKHFKWVTRISHSRFFDILRPLYPSTTAPKFIHFHREINFLRKCAFLDLADFWLIFRFFWAHRSLRLHIWKTKQATRTVLHIPR